MPRSVIARSINPALNRRYWAKDFKEEIRRACIGSGRNGNDMTQEELARRAGTTRNTLRLYLRDGKMPLSVFAKIVVILKLDGAVIEKTIRELGGGTQLKN